MTSKEAYEHILKWEAQGMQHKDIARELGKRGYVSWRTGKMIKRNSVTTMISRAKAGYIPERSPNVMEGPYAAIAKKTIEKLNGVKNGPAPTPKSAGFIHIASPDNEKGSDDGDVWDLAKSVQRATYLSPATKKAILQLLIDRVLA